ncbi:hypothetical protein FRUB_01890 [Fimbriiglobus ruber]|uniref:Uncharacterized protein n=1 Tax=Fimbriiglobus ruber TaxID=1908690 RepID=A0A225E7S2_9BACT|nr:hypothetical protein FRUB_01890 [Fimbriiglobus ruber]
MQQTVELLGRRRRVIHQAPEFRKRAIIEQEEHLIEQHVLRLPTGGVQHETLAGTSQVIGRLIDQVALLLLGPNVNHDGGRLASFCHKQLSISMIYR